MSDARYATRYRKTATVIAVKVTEGTPVKVYSLEGPALANPGDYIVTADSGESWVVAGPIFETTYEALPYGGAVCHCACHDEQVKP